MISLLIVALALHGAESAPRKKIMAAFKEFGGKSADIESFHDSCCAMAGGVCDYPPGEPAIITSM